MTVINSCIQLLLLQVVLDLSHSFTVTLKIAVDRNGGVADQYDPPARFTTTPSLDRVHRLRNASDAILVGVNTVRVDNPSLLVRRKHIASDTNIRQPLRVVLDSNLSLLQEKKEEQQRYQTTEDGFQILTDGYPTLLYYTSGTPPAATTATTTTTTESNSSNSSPLSAAVEYQQLSTLSPAAIVHNLQSRGLNSLMVEGGPTVAQSFLDVLDFVLLVRSPIAFSHPVPSGLSRSVFERRANLRYLGKYHSAQDTIECYSRDGRWPSKLLCDWP